MSALSSFHSLCQSLLEVSRGMTTERKGLTDVCVRPTSL